MGGAPCVRGLRIPVATVVGMIAGGMSEEEILKTYPDLEHEDIQEALQYASKNEFHALFVMVGKHFCKPKPKCNGCPLESIPHKS